MFNIVDLFAGPGGLSFGFEMVQGKRDQKVFNLLKVVEKEYYACKTLRRNFSRKKNRDVVVEGDIRNVDIKKLLDKTCRNKTDIILAGPPCQSFSLIGPRSGNSHNRKNKYKYDGLYMEFIDVVERLSPKFIVFENVKGILSKRKGNETVINVILSELRRMGYSFRSENSNIKTEYIVLNAADYGVPQTRERVFLIGNDIGVANPFPRRTHYDPEQENGGADLLPYVTLFDAIGDLPKVKPKKTMTHLSEREKIKAKRYNKRVYSGEEETKYNREWFKKHRNGLERSGKNFIKFIRPSSNIPLTHHTARPQMESDIKLFRWMKQGMTAKNVIESKDPKIRKLAGYIRYDMNSFKDKYKKQHWKKPCSTIFAHMQKDGNRFIHPDSRQARTLTPREAARIQSFPDSFYFEGPMTKKFQQIGNAVPVLLAKRIAESIYYELSDSA